MTGWRASRSTTGRSSWKAGVGTLAAGIAGFAAGLLLGKLLKPAGVGDDAGIDVSDDYRRELHIYLVGFGLALALTLAPFALVYWSAMPRSWLLIAIGAFAEAAMMFAWRRVGARFSARTTLLVAASAAIVRWAAMGLSPPVYVLVVLQLLQSLSFALGYLGAVHFVAKWTSEDIAAECQSFFVVLQQAASVIALTTFGWLIGFMGARAYFVAALFALVGAACIWLSIRMKQPRAG